MRRREFILLLGVAAWPFDAGAQQPAQIPKVGWIWPGTAAGNPAELGGFKQGLRELGYVEGRDIVVEYRFGEHSAERLPELAADLARLNVSVIIALGSTAVRAARRAAPDTPIVFLDADPIGDAVVTNLHRPGGNLTGVSVMRLGGKWPELAKEVLPTLTRIGYLINPTIATSVANLGEARRSAEGLGVDLPVLAIESLEQFEKIFDQLVASLKCQDMVEMIHIRDFAFAAWEEARYTRHRVVAFDRKFKDVVAGEVPDYRDPKVRQKAVAERLAEHLAYRPRDIGHLIELEDKVMEAADDVTALLKRTPAELAYNKARMTLIGSRAAKFAVMQNTALF
jgi:hypothetical protein